MVFYTRQPESSAATSVYHPVTTNIPMTTNISRGNPTYYGTSDTTNERNLDPLYTGTRHTPSDNYGSHQEATGDTTGVDLGGYPPPPTYNEVVSDPEKYHTTTESQGAQDEQL